MKTECTPRLALLNPRVLIGFALYAAGLVLALASMSSAVAGDDVAAELSSSIPAQATGGMWTATGDLGTPRWRHTATLLPNDQVLVAGGGGNSSDLASAQLYHPAIGRWQRIADMNHSHGDHTATLLPNGLVLVAGGVGCNSAGLGHCGPSELYDPTTRTWRDTGSLRRARWDHTATLLPNGQVLVAGGIVELFSTYTASAELYDPATGVWTATGSMTTKRGVQTATLLPNGQVLVAGGRDGDTFFTSAELYDSATGMWTATGSMATPRFVHTATLLPDGQVLVAGGDNFTDGRLASAELYQSATAVFDIQ